MEQLVRILKLPFEGPEILFKSSKYFTEGCTDLPTKQLDPMGPMAS